jgi:hypothetical protein
MSSGKASGQWCRRSVACPGQGRGDTAGCHPEFVDQPTNTITLWGWFEWPTSPLSCFVLKCVDDRVRIVTALWIILAGL